MFRDDNPPNVNSTTIRDNPGSAHFGVEDVGWQALAPAIGCTLLSTAVVGVRWYTRCKLARCLGMDDYVILLSVVWQR